MRVVSALGIGAAVVLLAVLVSVRLGAAEMHWILWGDRDLTRAIGLSHTWTTTGAELSYGSGARLPGGAWHVAQAPFFALRQNPVDVWRAWTLLDALAGVGLAWAVGRATGPVGGVATAAAYLGFSTARETLRRLWNPTMVPPLLGASHLVLLAGLSGRRWAWPVWGWLLALAGQAHFTGLLWMAASLAALVALRPRETVRHAPGVLLGVFVAYLPYLVAEATSGWANTWALTEQGPVHSARVGVLGMFEASDLLEAGAYLAPGTPRGQPSLRSLGVVFAAAALWGIARASALPPAVRDLSRVLAVATVANLLAPALDPGVPPEARYTLTALPAAAVLVGLGAAALGRAGWLVLAVGLAAPSVELYDRTLRIRGGQAYTWAGRKATLDAAREALGGDWSHLSGRFVMAFHDERGWAWGQPDPMDWLLAVEGSTFAGSQPGPCALGLADRPPEQAVDAGFVAGLLGLPGDAVRVLSVREAVTSIDLVVYDVSGRPCRTTATNRYIDTPVEAAIRPRWSRFTDGEVDVEPIPEGVRAVVGLDPPGPRSLRALLAIDLVPTAGRVTATLHGNQLRGWAYNGGWFESVRLDRPGLLLEPADGTAGPVEPVRLPFADEQVGWWGVVTPLTTAAEVPRGTWRVRFVASLLPEPEPMRQGPPVPEPGLVAVPVDRVLVERLDVP
jgi:hypothetical protein